MANRPSSAASSADNDFIIVTVGTPLGPDFEPIVDDIKAAARAVGEHLQAGHIVILKSTVPPDTTETLVRPILEEASGLRAGVDFGLAFCPERLAEGQAIHELTTIPVVVGAVDERSARACSTLWRHALGVESVVVDDPRTAEMVKLADNLWVDLNVALANELAKVWVSLPKLTANANTDALIMAWGNPNAPAAMSAKATYDATQLLVQHFVQDFKDASANANHAVANGVKFTGGA
jgi:nucleotide sugar dehydrogenase